MCNDRLRSIIADLHWLALPGALLRPFIVHNHGRMKRKKYGFNLNESHNALAGSGAWPRAAGAGGEQRGWRHNFQLPQDGWEMSQGTARKLSIPSCQRKNRADLRSSLAWSQKGLKKEKAPK